MRKQIKVRFAVAALACCVITAPIAFGAPPQHPSVSAGSVPFSCEIRQRAWCIQIGSVEVTDRQRVRGDDPPGSAWVVRGANVGRPRHSQSAWRDATVDDAKLACPGLNLSKEQPTLGVEGLSQGVDVASEPA